MTPLQKIRTRQKLTQRKVAQDLGIDPGQYSRFENGKERPTPEKAEILSRYFKGKVSELQLIYPERFMSGEAA